MLAVFSLTAWACDSERPPPVQLPEVAPKITSTAVTAATEGQAYSYAIVTTGNPSPTVGAVQVPAWIRLEGATLSGTPGAAEVGSHAIIIAASNGVEPRAMQSFTIEVSPATFARRPPRR